MLGILTLNSSIPEIFLCICVLGQLLFGSFVAYSAKYRYPIILKEVSTHTRVTGIILVLLYCIQFFVENSSIAITNNGIDAAKIVLSIVSLSILVFLRDAMQVQKISNFEFYFFYSTALLSLLIMLSVNDFLSFYLTMEAQTLCFYILACANRTNIFSIEAGLKYFIVGSFFSAIFLLGVAILYGCLGTINLGEIYALLITPVSGYSERLETLVLFAIVLITSTFLFKIAAAPFHFWLPDVYEGSPIASTMVFSILPKFPLIFFFIKWLISLNALEYFVKDSLVVIGVFSALIGTLYALKQLRAKRMILYSSIAQIGFIVAAIGLDTIESYTSVLFFTIIYVITSVLVWGNFVLIYKSKMKVSLVDKSTIEPLHISDFASISSYNVLWTIIFSVMFFSIAGIPPFVGFTAKFLILESLIADGFYLSAIALIFISSISVFYYIRLLKIAFFETKHKDTSYVVEKKNIIKTEDHDSFLQHFVIILLTFSLIILFFFPTDLLYICQYIILVSFF